MEDWDARKKEAPELNRQTVLEKVKSHFHVGEVAKTTAGIACFTLAPAMRDQGLQTEILKELVKYGKDQGRTSIEAYPFEKSAIEKHGTSVLWPGLIKGYVEAGQHLAPF